MKITIFNGSPRGRRSNTQMMADAFAEGARSAGAEVETIFLIEKNIKHCTGCFSCWKVTPGQCVQQDDMDHLLKLYKQSDVVCYGTPVYLWNMTACLKNFLDRLIPTKSTRVVEKQGNFDMENSVEKIPDVVILSNAGFPGENNFELMKAAVKPGNPILEIYRNCGMLLRTKEEGLQQKVREYLSYVAAAGKQTALKQKISSEVLEGLNMELLPVQEYVRYIGG